MHEQYFEVVGDKRGRQAFVRCLSAGTTIVDSTCVLSQRFHFSPPKSIACASLGVDAVVARTTAAPPASALARNAPLLPTATSDSESDRILMHLLIGTDRATHTRKYTLFGDNKAACTARGQRNGHLTQHSQRSVYIAQERIETIRGADLLLAKCREFPVITSTMLIYHAAWMKNNAESVMAERRTWLISQ